MWDNSVKLDGNEINPSLEVSHCLISSPSLPHVKELYAKVSPLFAEVPKGRLWETKKWEPPSVNKGFLPPPPSPPPQPPSPPFTSFISLPLFSFEVPLMKMWTWVAVGAGVVVGLTILLVIILQYTRKKDGYEVISDE